MRGLLTDIAVVTATGATIGFLGPRLSSSSAPGTRPGSGHVARHRSGLQHRLGGLPGAPGAMEIAGRPRRRRCGPPTGRPTHPASHRGPGGSASSSPSCGASTAGITPTRESSPSPSGADLRLEPISVWSRSPGAAARPTQPRPGALRSRCADGSGRSSDRRCPAATVRCTRGPRAGGRSGPACPCTPPTPVPRATP